jgi:hypothetical protein
MKASEGRGEARVSKAAGCHVRRGLARTPRG